MTTNQTCGNTYFELSNHLGNVLAVVTDRKLAQPDGSGGISYYMPDVVSATDYYPFVQQNNELCISTSEVDFANPAISGRMQMGERSFSSGSYRYGFNGMEKDNELKSDGNSYDFGARLLDVRLGRWLAVDPLASVYSGISDYGFAMNSPISLLDYAGGIIVDSDGNVIATDKYPERKVTSSFVKSAEKKVNADGSKEVYTVTFVFKDVYIYADDGTPIEAQILVDQYLETTSYDPEGIVTEVTKSDVDASKYNASTNCHGYAYVKGKVWLDGVGAKELTDHDYVVSDVRSANAVVFEVTEECDGGIVVDPFAHSSVVNADGSYSDNAGVLTTQESVSLEQTKRNFNVTKETYLKKKSPDRIIDIEEAVSKGVKTVDKSKLEEKL